MPLSAGTRLGPYEVVSPLGAGGMGEVYRVVDTRLGRQAAVKVLPQSLLEHRERIARFEREARAASALNHPNVVTIYETGSGDFGFYIAMEMVEGRTLREMLRTGPVPLRRLLPLAAQIADGLAKAHEAGIVHRDLKPDNVMVTKDGLVKILDFGVAKLSQAGEDRNEDSRLATMTEMTEPGAVLGTAGYMSPEQASGRTLDFRSDQFSLGSILYEMATGRRAFERDTSAQTLAAIIQDEPEPIGVVNPAVPAPLRWIIERCLAKDAEARYVSTRDLARELATVRDRLSETAASSAAPGFARKGRPVFASALVFVLLAVSGASFWLLRGRPHVSLPTFQRLTFRRGQVTGARFTADGRSIVFSAAFDGSPARIFLTRPESPEALQLPLPEAMLKSVSASGELAITLGGKLGEGRTSKLATVPLTGGTPREIDEDIGAAVWSRDGRDLAIVRSKEGRQRLEFPRGHVLRESSGGILGPGVSPDGKRIVFVEEFKSVHVVDLSGSDSLVSRGWAWVGSARWSPSGDEVWFSASMTGLPDTLRATTLSGRERLLARAPGWITLCDVSKEGRTLVTIGTPRWEIWTPVEGEARDRDLSWLGMSVAVDLTLDGRTVLFNEVGEGGGRNSAAYLRGTDGSPAVKILDREALALSPDGKQVVALEPGSSSSLSLVPTGAGMTRSFAVKALDRVAEASWFPDGRRLLIRGTEPGRKDASYVVDPADGKSARLAVESMKSSAISPDGRFIAVESASREFWSYPVDGGPRRPISGVATGETLLAWSSDGKALFTYDRERLPFEVYRVDLDDGRRTRWKTVAVPDRAGLLEARLLMTPNGGNYVLQCRRWVNDLYLVDGIK